MAKQIIVLDVNNNQSGGSTFVRAVFWFPVVNNPIPRTSITASAFPGASAGEITALQNGSVLEEVRSLEFPSGLADATLAARVQEFYTARANWYAGQIPPGKYFGQYYDGSVWHATGT